MIRRTIKKNSQKETVTETGITTAERLGTEEPATVTTGFVEPDIDIDSGATITTQTETEKETETTTEAPASAPQGQYAYTYTIYDGIVLSMDVNVDDYIVIGNDGTPCFRLFQLAGDMGWMSMGIYDKAAVDASNDTSVYGPDWWSYSNGEMRTKFSISYPQSAFLPEPYSDMNPFDGASVSFIEQDTIIPYYPLTDNEINHTDITIDVEIEYSRYEYSVSGYSCMISRDDLILLAYILWFMPQHCGEAEPLCSQFGSHWGKGGSHNYLTLK